VLEVVAFTFNPFQEQTYVVADATGACVIFDPGCWSPDEERELERAIAGRGWRPERLINTHCHLDHVFGNAFVAKTYDLPLELHPNEVPVLDAVPQVCMMYGLPPAPPQPEERRMLPSEGQLEFGDSALEILFVPGHAPGHLCFYSAEAGILIAGDTLFQGSIGRTDLPGGDHETLLHMIKTQLLTLPEETIVYPGHGPSTTIGAEKRNNPFVGERA
jgi:glyoxylase-like metal-dependent hydrolase (beta-lactamase superfamily II)